ncbi:MAG: 50S ribosomal protein L24 [Gemmatimonadales bacterium]|jgi:large subunit ribosomal protein L24
MRILKYKKTDRARHKGQKRHAQNAERVKLHVATGDTVKVVRGDDKGHVGKVTRVYRKTGRVVVEGANFVKRHRKARTAEDVGGIVSFEAPIHASNVMLLDPKNDKPTRTRRRIDADGTKERLSVKSGEAIPRVR